MLMLSSCVVSIYDENIPDLGALFASAPKCMEYCLDLLRSLISPITIINMLFRDIYSNSG